MSHRSRSTRIAAAALLALLSVVGISGAGVASGTVGAERSWCC